MWRKIKSIFILKKIFNNIESKRKLNLILYNKKIQKKLGFGLIDFKRFSGRYKVEKNGEIKEYDSYSNILLFEGHMQIEKEMDMVKNMMKISI